MLLTLIVPLAAGCAVESSEGPDPDDGRYHEQAFRLGDDEDPVVIAGRAHRTELSQNELDKEMDRLAAAITKKDFRNRLSLPLDYGCDLVQLALFQEHGTLRVAGIDVVGVDALRRSCRPLQSDEPTVEKPARRTEAQDPPPVGSWPASEVDDRQYPYKMIGRSWHNFDIGVYKSTGAETQFQKRRKRGWWDVTAWWGLDADRIGIRTYYFDCPSLPEGHPMQRVCFGAPGRPSSSDWQAHDDYVGERDMAVGGGISFNLQGWLPAGLKGVWNGTFDVTVVPGYDPYERVATYTQIPDVPKILLGVGQLYGMNRQDVANWFANSWIPYVPALNQGPSVSISNAAMGMHSVNHGSMRFRAISSSGLGGRTFLITSANLYDFVQW
jgi:hypothetical protein